MRFLKINIPGGGIWLMNLKKIRADNLEQKMLDVIADETIYKRWPDQDVINIACGGHVGFLPLNYISYPYLLDLLVKPDFVSDYTRDELYDSLINPKIIHFAANKPWNNNPQYSNLWWTYFHYLKLEKTAIFKEDRDPSLKKWKKKCRKYQMLFILCLVAFLLVFFILLK